MDELNEQDGLNEHCGDPGCAICPQPLPLELRPRPDLLALALEQAFRGIVALRRFAAAFMRFPAAGITAMAEGAKDDGTRDDGFPLTQEQHAHMDHLRTGPEDGCPWCAERTARGGTGIPALDRRLLEEADPAQPG